MASDQQLVDRLSRLLSGRKGVTPRRMFGGTCFTLNGNMCVGVHNKSLMLRVGSDQAEGLFTEPHVKPMDLTGKVMKGWAEVLPDGLRDDKDLLRYAEMALTFVATLPAKEHGSGATAEHRVKRLGSRITFKSRRAYAGSVGMALQDSACISFGLYVFVTSILPS
jgi:TfoX/Sxy family transcriptional regulator of competence genes